MFRTFARVPDVGARKLFLFHPMDLTSVLELAWDRRGDAVALTLGHPLHRSDLDQVRRHAGSAVARLSGPAPTARPRPELPDLNFLLASSMAAARGARSTCCGTTSSTPT